MQEIETLIKKVEALTASFAALSDESRKEKEAHKKGKRIRCDTLRAIPKVCTFAHSL